MRNPFPWPDDTDRVWLTEFGLAVVRRTEESVTLESPHVRVTFCCERGQVLGDLESRALRRSYPFTNVVRALRPASEFHYREPGSIDRATVRSECERMARVLSEDATAFLRGEEEAQLRVDEFSRNSTQATLAAMAEYSRTRRQELRDAAGPGAKVDVRALAWPTEKDAGWLREFGLSVVKREEQCLVLASPHVALSLTIDRGEVVARLHAPPDSQGHELALVANVIERDYLLGLRALLPLDPAAAVCEFERLSGIARERCAAYLRGDPETIRHVDTCIEIYRKGLG